MKEKLCISGNIIELIGYTRLNTDARDMNQVRQGTGKKRAENYAQRQQKRRDMIRRLATTNFNTAYTKFVTLTFKENVTDLRYANKEFKKFIQRMRRRYGGFKYICVIEFQERGAIHYHMISDLPYIPYGDLAKIWGNGDIDIRAVDKVDNIGAYLVKYMTKENDDERLQGENGYLISRGLIQPTTITTWGDGNELFNSMIHQYGLEKKLPTYASTYESEYNGITYYLQFNLSRQAKK